MQYKRLSTAVLATSRLVPVPRFWQAVAIDIIDSCWAVPIGSTYQPYQAHPIINKDSVDDKQPLINGCRYYSNYHNIFGSLQDAPLSPVLFGNNLA